MIDAEGGVRPRLLYIDDDEGLGRLVTRALGRRGLDVDACTDPRAGVARLETEAFEAVALDHYMPGQDGLATLQQIKALPAPPPVVYVTGSDESRIAIAALKAGASDYVIKSGSEEFTDLLFSAVRQAVDQERMRRSRDEAQAALAEANRRLEAVVVRQEALLREVNHRVANSLQLVSSLVHMQTAAVRDGEAKDALRDTQARISAIMQVHRRLYTSDDVERVDVSEYLQGLVSELQLSLPGGGDERAVRFEADHMELPTDKVISLGVVVAELVTNAFKYAYGRGEAGEIRVALHRHEGRMRLTVADDGEGFAPGSAPKGTGLGGKVIGAMASSLGGRLAYDHVPRGVCAALVFDA